MLIHYSVIVGREGGGWREGEEKKGEREGRRKEGEEGGMEGGGRRGRRMEGEEGRREEEGEKAGGTLVSLHIMLHCITLHYTVLPLDVVLHVLSVLLTLCELLHHI